MSKLRKSLLISLTALFVLTVAIFGMLKLTAARAADVLGGNSATYSFVNDPKYPWEYDRSTNTWSNIYGSSYGLAKVFTINITSEGSVEFEYKANLYNTNKQGSKQSANSQNDFYIKLVKGGVENNIVALHGVKMSEYQKITIPGLNAGDSIVFTHKLAMSSTSEDDKVYIRGLTKPAGGNVKIDATVEGNGKISSDGVADTADFSKTIESGSALTLTAKPDEGNTFAYWEQDGAILSYDPVLNLKPLAAASYKARFVGEDYQKFTTDGWEESSAGGTAYKLSETSVGKKTSTLTYEFVGEGYLYFSMAHNLEKVGESENALDVTLNGDDSPDIGGELPSYSSNNNKPGFDKNAPQFDDCYIHVTGKGYHRLDFVYNKKDDNADFVKTTKDYFEIKDFEVRDAAEETIQINLEYNQKYGTILVDGAPTDPNGSLTVPKGVKVGFSAVVFPTVTSAIDGDQQVAVRWEGFYTDSENIIEQHWGTDKGELWPDESFYLIFSDEGATYGNDVKMNGHHVIAKMHEYAVAPQVSIDAQIDKVMQGEKKLENGQTYEVPYGSAVNVSVLMTDFEGVDSVYHVKINDVEVDKPQITEDAGRKIFLLSDITADTKVTVYYSAEGYYDSAEFTFNIVVADNGSLTDNLLIPEHGDVTVENDPFMPWQFNAGLSGENGIAYVASNSGSLGYYGVATSSLKFTVQGVGTLDFDFKIYNASNWLIFTTEEPISISNSITSLYSKNIFDPLNETVWKINGGSFGDDSYKNIIARGSTSERSNDGAPYKGNYMYWFTGTYEGDKTTSMLDDGWAHVSIPVGTDSMSTDVYVTYYRNSDYYGYTLPFCSAGSEDYAAIRKVGFFKGIGTVNYSVNDANGGDITVTSGKDNVETGTQVNLGSRVTFKAQAKPGYQFYGWVDGNDVFITDSAEYTTALTGDIEVKAIFATTDSYVARNNGKFYTDLKAAFEDSHSGDTILLLKDGVKITESTELPEGVKFVMPVNDRGDWYELGTNSNSSERVSWSEANSKKNYLLKTLTIENDAVLTIRGNFYIGAVLNHPEQYAQGLTSGNYNKLVLNGNIVVEEGGMLDVMGLVTGDGGITVNKGGKLYQPFMILDYSGGTNTQAMFGEGVTPFKMYAMVNIQCKNGYTIKYGGALYGHASLYFWKGTNTIDQPFITYKEGKDELATALIILDSEDSYVHTVYDDKDYDTTENGQHKRVEMEAGNNTQDVGFTKMEIVGDASAGYMSFPLGINTAGVNFSLPYNYSLNIKSGTFTVANHFKLMPGSSVTVESEAKVVVAEGKSLQVYDSFYGPSVAKRAYPTGAQLIAAGYKPYADFVVNGTLELKEGATFVGTVQNEGTGTIIVGDNVKLSAELFDGVATQYTCNYTKYTLNAQIWDAAHGEMRTPEAGKTYKAASEVATFNLPGIKFEYENGDTKHNNSSHTLAELTTEQASGLKGSWVVEHAGHQYEWNYTDEEYPTDGERVKTVTRQCTQTGCNDMGEHHLLYTETALNLGDITFKNSAVTESDIRTLLTAYYGEEIETLIQSIAIDGEKINHGQNYAVTVTLTDGAYFYAEGATKEAFTFNYNIKEADLTDVTLSRAEKTYDGTAITEEIISKVVAGGLEVNAEDYDVNIALKSGGANSANAGVYTVTVTGKNNFKGTVSKDFTINRVQITVNVKKNLTATYAGIRTAPAIPAEAYEISGTPVGSDRVQVTVRYNSSVNTWKAGNSFALTADVKITNGNAANYNITVHEGSITLTKKAVSLKIGNKTSVYGKTPDKNWEVEGVEGFAGDFDETTILGMLNVTCEVTKDSTAGDYTINAQWKPGRDAFDNFDVTLQGGTYTVSPAEYADVTFEGETEVTYDGNEHYLTVKAPEGAEVTITYKLRDGEEEYSDKKPVAAGTYDVKAVITSQNYNSGAPYTINGTLEITPAQIASVTVSGSYTYDGTVKELEVTVTTENGLTLTQDDYTVQCENFVNAQEDIEYTVTAKGNNYAGSQSTTFTIAKKAVTVKIEDQSKVYDANDPSLAQTFEIEGLVEGQDIGLRLKLASGGKDAGEYRITYEVTAEAVANNYKITYCTYDGRAITDVNYPKYTVTPAQATITVNDLTSEYGDEVKTNYTFESEGFLPDGYTPKLNYQCEVEQGDNVGAYDITATVENSNDNYTIKVNKGRYEVTKRHIKITVNDGESVYGETIPEEYAGYTLSEGEKYGNDDLHITYIKYAAGTDAKTYTIGAKCGNKNYDAEIVEGKWTITKKPVTGIMVIVSDGTTDYTDTEGNGVIHVKYVGKTLTVRAGAPQPYDELRVTTTVTQINGAGTYQVTAKIVDANYSGETTVTIEAAPDLNSTLALLESLKAQLSGEELTADDFAVLKQMNELISALDEDDRDSAELDEYMELIASWNEAANVDEAAVEQVNDLADDVLAGLIATLSAATALAYVVMVGGKAV